MEKETGIVLGIALFFMAASGAFSFLMKIAGMISFGFAKHLRLYSLWFIVVAGAAAVLYMLYRRQNLGLDELIKNNIIRRATGALVIIDSLIKLSTSIITYICNVISYKSLSPDMGVVIYSSVLKSILNDRAVTAILILQIIFGVYLLRLHKKDNDAES